MIYQHSNLERQREVAAGGDARVQTLRSKASGTDPAREPWTGLDNTKAPGLRPEALLWSG